uniref:Uncharacterized protein n=1 Tax=Chromera velia CCMP2878 TaxID=1169474 RepID=A0A0G4G127_9ALVE|mmetsp:Transcript_36678/g.72152  ORF Transcript_36678/g.72152 Transcript_36678/m.72152 type:complete len:114 (-) Transcript_36678:419-760(-)|eukprot:Cvel_19630.t1-p1 / transcript=Cvel_19630.t1 / gene=Cvel_19630 / organism=Chromera_velia_CCMP2878 / gene_product=hypothetical protein / transcript_product=hypothetical protein / location=Cvel_scaffold1709:345-683(+) / protein_length=113 / sequence_SO=supercontig / SO=protein_coding / is_pseudo=false
MAALRNFIALLFVLIASASAASIRSHSSLLQKESANKPQICQLDKSGEGCNSGVQGSLIVGSACEALKAPSPEDQVNGNTDFTKVPGTCKVMKDGKVWKTSGDHTYKCFCKAT